MTETDRVAELLADTTPWTLADIVREIGMSPKAARQSAWHQQMGDLPHERALPAPLPGTPGVRFADLHRASLGQLSDPQPHWCAGAVRRWAMQCGRLDHDLNPVPRHPAREN